MIKVDLIVSRHAGAIDWLREHVTCDAEPVASASADDVRGKVVAGNLPLHLADQADRVLAIEFRGQPPRGAEYTAADMREAGARLVSYCVVATQTIPVGDLDAVMTAKLCRWRP